MQLYQPYFPFTECQVTHWGQWSQCHPSRLCASEIPEVEHTTYHLPAAKYDEGREHMNILKQMKADHWKKIDECQKDEACKSDVTPSALGFTPCVDGKDS